VSEDARRHVVGRVADLDERGRLIVEVGGRTIGIFRVEGRLYAVLNRCPHQGAELCRGEILRAVEASDPGDYRYGDRHLLVCPWHNWEFDIATGQSYWDPERTRVKTYDVQVEPGGRVPGPLRVDTFPVEAEGEYIVVTMGRNRSRAPRPPG
jgi:nitrite reductase/ring-hydroxylating ferredoxin subunit